MLNQVVLVGRLVKKPELREAENKSKYAYITLAVPRSFKNADGKYESDFIDCVLWNNIAINTADYCDKGNIIGIRGRIQSRIVENQDKNNEKVTEVICERVTFLSSNPPETTEEETGE